jgi:hypothetical protein
VAHFLHAVYLGFMPRGFVEDAVSGGPSWGELDVCELQAKAASPEAATTSAFRDIRQCCPTLKSSRSETSDWRMSSGGL